MEMGINVMEALADLLLSAMLVAFTLTICWAVTSPGAEYTPVVETLPTPGETLHDTEVFVVPVTEEVSCWLCDASNVDEVGETATDTVDGAARMTTVEVPTAVGSSLQMAFTVTVCCVEMFGAL